MMPESSQQPLLKFKTASDIPWREDSRATTTGCFTWQKTKERVWQFMPILEWLPRYPLSEFIGPDVAGAITLGCLVVAESLAHADLCKVRLIHGPYSCILPPVVYAIFGTCMHSSIGTGGLVALLTGVQMAQYPDIDERTHNVAILTLEVGLLLALMGFFQLGFLVRFLSRPALSGFITASALLIIVSVIPPVLGLPPTAAAIGAVELALSQPEVLVEQSNYATVALSSASLLFLITARQLKNSFGWFKTIGNFKELFVLALSIPISVLYAERYGIEVVGEVPEGLPRFTMPIRSRDDMRIAKELLPGAALIALVVFLSSFAGAKKFAMMDGYRIGPLNEFLGLGMANAAGAFNGGVPIQIGLSRMGIAHGAGVKSQVGTNILVAVIVAAVVASLSPYMFFVPRCVLNCIILNGASHLTEWDQMRWLWSLPDKCMQRYILDLGVWWVALLATLYFGAFEGIIFAVGVSLILILYQVLNPPIIPLGKKGSQWVNLTIHPKAQKTQGVLIFRFEGPIFYANVERLQEWLDEQEELHNAQQLPLYGVILSASAVTFVDTTALQALQRTIEAYQRRDIAFIIANPFGQAGRAFQQVLGHLLYPESIKACLSVDQSLDLLLRKKDRAPPAPRPLKSYSFATLHTLADDGAFSPSLSRSQSSLGGQA